MKNKLLMIAAMWLTTASFAFGQVTGKALLLGQTDHSGIKVKFTAQSPTAKTDSVYTGADGGYSIPVKAGNYIVQFSKTDYYPIAYKSGAVQFIPSQSILETTTLNNFTYLSGLVKGKLKKDKIYVINEDITVAEGDSLIIEPGTRIYVDGLKNILILGYIEAKGTISDSIYIQSYSRIIKDSINTTWIGFHLDGPKRDFEFSYCVISDAKEMIQSDIFSDVTRKLVLRNSRISNCEEVIHSYFDLSFTNNYFKDNGIIFSDVNTNTKLKNYRVNCNLMVNSRTIFLLQNADTLVFKDNIIYYNRDAFDWLIGYKVDISNNSFSNFKSYKFSLISNSASYRIYNNLFDGDLLNVDYYNSDIWMYNNIFNSKCIFTPYHYDIKEPIQFTTNIFAKSITTTLPGYGHKITTNANGDSVDTFLNLFQDPEFMNNKPPYLAAGSPAIGAGLNALGQPVNIGFDPTGTCIAHHFVREPVVKQADSLSISGRVHTGSSLLSNGIILAIAKNSGKVRTSKVANGNFTIDSLLQGEYLLYAIPDPAKANGFVPTYYVNKTRSTEAVTLPLVSHIRETDLYLAHINTVTAGKSSLKGHFIYGDNATDRGTPLSKNWFSTSALTEASPVGEACQNMPVWLFNSSNDPVGTALTDANGYFHFKNLPQGNYKIVGERYLYVSEDKGAITLEAEEEKAVLLHMYPSAPTGLSDFFPIASEKGIIAYPNPFAQELTLPDYSGTVEITNSQGQVYYTNNDFNAEKISTSSWPNGLYLLKTGNKVQKLMKK